MPIPYLPPEVILIILEHTSKQTLLTLRLATKALYTLSSYTLYKLLASEIQILPETPTPTTTATLHLHRAAHHPVYLTQLHRLLISKADPNVPSNSGETPLHVACRNKNIQAVKMLLKAGADVNAVTGDGWTALLLCAREGFFEIVEVLVEYGAEVNYKGVNGWTALHLAVRGSWAFTVQRLLGAGADRWIVDEDGERAGDVLRGTMFGRE
ncbi:ankyrin repeat-containing domain protein [Aspergillus avenaceus]|uniref:Ankyrin repeat-containing domain protein n=1 Tax=Aspergillus avenaceus TaxID=36643 RepID=A0A5N6TVV8_ASPAV|nr:ankyrin repeat-containing domain protein [Aspergillus avenaceus]